MPLSILKKQGPKPSPIEYSTYQVLHYHGYHRKCPLWYWANCHLGLGERKLDVR